MKVCWFAFVHCAEGDRAADRDRLVAGLGPVLSALSGLAKAVIHCCTVADDPFLRDGDPPNMVLQCYFDSDIALAEALGPGSPLLDLQDPERFPMLAHASVTHQAMEVRRFETSSARQTPDSHATLHALRVSFGLLVAAVALHAAEQGGLRQPHGAHRRAAFPRARPHA